MSATKRLAAIDALRGIAVLAVLVNHLPFSTTTTPAGSGGAPPPSVFPEWLVAVLDHGRYGVHLFLVISGFCIHMAWARQSDTEARVDFMAFWKRRLHRLYPPYFAALLLSIAGLFVLHGILAPHGGGIAARLGYASEQQLAVDLVLLLLLAQNLNGASHRIGNGPFWTLALEEQLYALYFPLLWMRRRFGWGRAIGIVAAVTIGWRTMAAFLTPASWQDTLFLVGPSRWFEWALGALAVEAYLGRVQLPAWCRSGRVGLGLLAIAFAVFNAPRLGVPLSVILPFTDVLTGTALFVLVNFACRIRWADADTAGVIARFFAWVGTFSYSLYLTHQLVIVAAKQLALRLGVGTAGILALRIVAPIFAAWVFYQLVERRFLSSSRRAAAVSGFAAGQPAAR